MTQQHRNHTGLADERLHVTILLTHYRCYMSDTGVHLVVRAMVTEPPEGSTKPSFPSVVS